MDIVLVTLLALTLLIVNFPHDCLSLGLAASMNLIASADQTANVLIVTATRINESD